MLAGAAHFERIRSVMSKVACKRFGFREALIVPPFSTFQLGDEFREKKQLVRSGLLSRRLYLSLLDPVEENLERLNEFGPDILQGYGSYLELLFQYVHATGSQFHRPRVVVFYADAMSDSARRIATDVLGIPVLSVYGAIEAFHIGFECEENTGYHLTRPRSAPNPLCGRPRGRRRAERGRHRLESRQPGDRPSQLPPRRRRVAAPVPMPLRADAATAVVHRRPHRRLDRGTERRDPPSPDDSHALHRRGEDLAVPGRADDADRLQGQGGRRRLCRPEALTRRLAQKFVGRLGPGTRIDTEFVASVPRSSGGKVRSVVALDRTRAYERVTRS